MGAIPQEGRKSEQAQRTHDKARAHWAFQPVTKPEINEQKSGGAIRPSIRSPAKAGAKGMLAAIRAQARRTKDDSTAF
jgi:hypothetical protein